jgi:hypothetical protein
MHIVIRHTIFACGVMSLPGGLKTIKWNLTLVTIFSDIWPICSQKGQIFCKYTNQLIYVLEHHQYATKLMEVLMSGTTARVC